MLPTISTARWLLGKWGEVRSLHTPPPPFLTSVVPPEAPESTRETWEDKTPLWDGQGLSLQPRLPWLWVSPPAPGLLGCQWGAVASPPQGPNLLGCLLILVGTLVLSKNIRDSGQGLRRNEKQKNSRVSKSPERRKQTAQAAAGPWRTRLGSRSPQPPAFSLGGCLCLWFVLESDPVSNPLLGISL